MLMPRMGRWCAWSNAGAHDDASRLTRDEARVGSTSLSGWSCCASLEPTLALTPHPRDLFIVDNSVSGWTALRYLEEWSEIAKGFDVATGHFEIGALLALDGKWQRAR
jgi:hypothetical protein